MAVLPIYTYSHPVLRKKARAVKLVDDQLIRFVEDLFETMHKANGIGLAATQVGSLRRVIVVDVSDVVREKEQNGSVRRAECPVPHLEEHRGPDCRVGVNPGATPSS